VKKGMKLRESTPVITEYEDASDFPDQQNANSYCKEMNRRSPGWTVEKMKLAKIQRTAWTISWRRPSMKPCFVLETPGSTAHHCKHHEGCRAVFASGWSQAGCKKPEAWSSPKVPNRTSKWVSTPTPIGSPQIWHLSFPRESRWEINSELSVGEAHRVFSILLRPHIGQSKVTVQPNQ
jgi:hypothetical protein